MLLFCHLFLCRCLCSETITTLNITCQESSQECYIESNVGSYCNYLMLSLTLGLPLWLSGKERAYNAGATGLIPGSGRSPGGRAWQPTPVFLPGNDDMHLKIFSKMQNLKSTVFLIVPIFHNSNLHILTLCFESSIQIQDKPVLHR